LANKISSPLCYSSYYKIKLLLAFLTGKIARREFLEFLQGLLIHFSSKFSSSNMTTYDPSFHSQIFACTRTCVRYIPTHFGQNDQTLLRDKITVQHCNFKITYILMKALNQLDKTNGPIINHAYTHIQTCILI